MSNTQDEDHDRRDAPYPTEAVVQSQLKNWTRRLEATARKQKFGAALHLATMEPLTMTPGLATQASQLWGAVIGTIQHSEALMQEAEGYEMAHPEFNENGAWLMAMLTRRLPACFAELPVTVASCC